MPETTIKIVGLDELIKKFKHIDGNMKPMLNKTMKEAVLYVHSTVPPYPSPPAGSTYTRTDVLGGSITTEVKSLGAEVVGLIGTPIIYGPYVISEDDQAWMHKGRWWTLQQVVRDASNEILGFFQIAVRKLLRS